MPLRISQGALRDLENIHKHIAQDNPDAADRVIDRILQSAQILADFPLIGRPGRIQGKREWPVSGLPYFAVYEVDTARNVLIASIVHTSRQWPPSP